MINERPDVTEKQVPFKTVIDVENYFKHKYKIKFKRAPYTSIADRNNINVALKGGRTYAQITMLIDHYFKMTNSWFKSHHYSLDTFLLCISRVADDMALGNEKNVVQSPKLITVQGFCRNVKCSNRFEVVVPPSLEGLDNKYCSECLKANPQS